MPGSVWADPCQKQATGPRPVHRSPCRRAVLRVFGWSAVTRQSSGVVILERGGGGISVLVMDSLNVEYKKKRNE